jgi:hypothetical protein
LFLPSERTFFIHTKFDSNAEFNHSKEKTKTTAGNFSFQTGKLEGAGYVKERENIPRQRSAHALQANAQGPSRLVTQQLL